MPILLIGSGLALVLVGLNGDPGKLYALLANDFTGKNSFVYWMLAILVLGGLGYVPGLDKISKAFLVLVILVLLLDNGGFFKHFQDFVKSTTQTAPAAPNTAPKAPAATGGTQ
jgi:hypothetical protein